MLETYSTAIAALAALGALMLTQLIIADVASIRRRHIPGTTVAADHNDALFRVTRTVANTNESVAIFIVLLLYGTLSGASPTLIAYAAWGYVIMRVLYAACYYANIPLLRSTSFGLSLVSLLAMLLVGLFSS